MLPLVQTILTRNRPGRDEGRWAWKGAPGRPSVLRRSRVYIIKATFKQMDSRKKRFQYKQDALWKIVLFSEITGAIFS